MIKLGLLLAWSRILVATVVICALPRTATADPQTTPPLMAQTQSPSPATTPNQPQPTAGTATGLTDPAPLPAPLVGSGGWRARLHAQGVDLRLDYVSETAVNTTGGKERGSAYAQQLRFGMDLNLGKLLKTNGATFHLALNDRAGGGLSANDLGNKLAVQEVYGAGQNFRLSELTIDQNLVQKGYNVKFGFWAPGNDFGATALLCNFMSSGFCGHPQSLPNDSGWSDYPTAKWGLRMRANTSAITYVETGAFEVNPTSGAQAKGFNMSLHGATGALYPAEFAWLSGTKPGQLPGEYKVGAYYDSSAVPDIGTAKMTDDGRWGYYVLASQMVVHSEYRRGGLWVFAQATDADPRTALIKYYLDGGIVLQGIFADRERDNLNIGIARAAVNSRALAIDNPHDLALAPGEQLAELNYGISVSPTVMVRPVVQYVMNPGAFAFKNYADAWVYGLQIKSVF